MAAPDANSFEPALDEIRFALRASGLDHVFVQRGENLDALALIDDVLRQAATFAADVFAPINSVGDRQGCRFENGRVILPAGFAEAYRAYVAAGWAGVGLPTRYGGQQLPVMVAVAVAEMFNSANMALSTSMMACGGAVALIDRFGSDAQKRVYLPKIASGEWPVTMVITEPQAGSDVGAIQTRAVQDCAGYRLRGQKAFISFGEHDMT
ncbi:MAG: acyl-CoA dehydrogenase family protein, partial [Bradyrhizobium guangdongense]